MRARILVAYEGRDIAALFRQKPCRDLLAGRFVLGFAMSGGGALQSTADSPEPLVLVLSDISMPSISGLDLMPQLKSEHPARPVRTIIADGDDATGKLVSEWGAAGRLSKSIDSGYLRRELEARMHR